MFDWQSLIKYILEGLAVAIATYLIPSNKIEYTDIIIIALTAAAVFAVLDQFSPIVANSARQGSGFALGYQQVGFGEDPEAEQNLSNEDDENENINPITDDNYNYSPIAISEDEH